MKSDETLKKLDEFRGKHKYEENLMKSKESQTKFEVNKNLKKISLNLK